MRRPDTLSVVVPTKRDLAASAFLVGGLLLAFAVDAGRLSLAFCLAGSLIGCYIKHGDDRASVDRTDRPSEARYLAGFACLVLGAVLAVIGYPRWEYVALIVSLAVAGLLVVGVRWRGPVGRAPSE